MKKPREHLKTLYDKRAKKKARRKSMLAKRDARPHVENATSAPRWMRRIRELVGTSYWRGDRRVLEDYFVRGCQ
jgi:hypothetical protein